jgi:hypothetical protein
VPPALLEANNAALIAQVRKKSAIVLLGREKTESLRWFFKI